MHDSIIHESVDFLQQSSRLSTTQELQHVTHHHVSKHNHNNDKNNKDDMDVADDIETILPPLPFAPATGGVLLYMHVPKTGGTTIRNNFGNKTRFPDLHFYPIHQLSHMPRGEKMIQERILRRNKKYKTLFVEIHGRNCPTWLELAPMIQGWRKTAAAHHVPFFAFTLLREPVELAVSFFNFFRVTPGDDRFGPRVNSTQQNLLATLKYNPQCLFLTKGETAFFEHQKDNIFYNVTHQDCIDVQTQLTQTLDWIGDTRHMSHDTLPLLTYLLTGNAQHGQALPAANTATARNSKLVSVPTLDLAARQQIQDMSMLDHQLYQLVMATNDIWRLPQFQAESLRQWIPPWTAAEGPGGVRSKGEKDAS